MCSVVIMHADRLTRVATAVFWIINSVFIIKYGLRIMPWPVVTLCVVLYGLLLGFIASKSIKASARVLLFSAVGLLVCMMIAQSWIDPYSVNVDRWSAIHFWWKSLFAGIFPYESVTHLGQHASPFPVWQAFHLPFYLIGNVELSCFVGIGAFIWVIYRYIGTAMAWKALLLIATSPVTYFDIFAYSDYQTNIRLLASVIVILYATHRNISNSLGLLAVVIGLFLSTRLIVAIPFFILYLREWLQCPWQRKTLFIAGIVLVFFVTFVPFLFWEGTTDLFFKYNPFVLQTHQGNPVDFVIFVPMAIGLAFWWKNDFRKYNLACGLMLFAFIAITYGHLFLNAGMDGFYDITYLTSALPFLILAIDK